MAHIMIDRDICQGHLRCCDLVPELFEADRSGYTVALVPGPLSAEEQERAMLAVQGCPERAIRLERGRRGAASERNG